ncbi:hypothetical protein [Nonomuraea dietziae]|uniref:hypothetical protein n=1 Tax=Nonomuraea dietziae TaxID=65515 RepID=UPI0031D25A0D
MWRSDDERARIGAGTAHVRPGRRRPARKRGRWAFHHVTLFAQLDRLPPPGPDLADHLEGSSWRHPLSWPTTPR